MTTKQLRKQKHDAKWRRNAMKLTSQEQTTLVDTHYLKGNGWTAYQIKKHLYPPDLVRHYRCGRKDVTAYLFDKKRVTEAETARGVA